MVEIINLDVLFLTNVASETGQQVITKLGLLIYFTLHDLRLGTQYL